MTNKLHAGLVGAIAVVVILGLQAIEHWTIVDALLGGLNDKGPVGAFVVGLLMSPVLPLVIALAAIYLVFEGRREKEKDGGDAPSARARADASMKDSGNATASIGDIHLHPPGPAIVTPLPKEPGDPPIISFEEMRNIYIAHSGWVFIEHTEGTAALVAVFRNKIKGVGIPTPIARRVLAHVTFRSKERQSALTTESGLGSTPTLRISHPTMSANL